MLGTGWIMAKRVGSFNAHSDRRVFAFDTRNDTKFEFSGKPVEITTNRTDVANQMLIVRYGDETLKIRATIPGNEHLPGLLAHEDWMRLVRFGVMTGRTMKEFKRDLGNSPDLPDRLAIVTKVPRPGSDPNSWGQIWIKDWSFAFYEFQPQGGFKTAHYRFPTNKMGQAPKEGELPDNTWEFQAALQLMPQQARERLIGKYNSDAMHQLGWTLPAAAVCGSVCIFALGFAIAPRRYGASGASPTEPRGGPGAAKPDPVQAYVHSTRKA